MGFLEGGLTEYLEHREEGEEEEVVVCYFKRGGCLFFVEFRSDERKQSKKGIKGVLYGLYS